MTHFIRDSWLIKRWLNQLHFPICAMTPFLILSHGFDKRGEAIFFIRAVPWDSGLENPGCTPTLATPASQSPKVAEIIISLWKKSLHLREFIKFVKKKIFENLKLKRIYDKF